MTNIFFTFDYELGMTRAGTVEKSLISPTNSYCEVFAKYGVRATWFVDAAYLLKLHQLVQISGSESLLNDWQLITTQLQTLIAQGHDIQLHQHPQWQYSTYHDGEWTMDDGTHYALSDLAPEEASQLFESGAELLAQITGRKPMAFRAGGYTLQTWDYVKLFRDNGIKIDSSVRPGGYATGECHSGNNSRQQYDYRTIGFFHRYRFQHDVSICAINGEYVELPVSLAVIPKWKFLWQRYRYNDPEMIRIWADANQGATGMARGSKLKNFMKGFLSNASLDSKSARHLEQVYQIVSKKSNDFVVCSHPKGIAGYSIKFLEAFLSKHRKERFLTISDLITQNKQ